jgi:hypothetical protein
MNNNPKIAVIAVWYGDWPVTFKYWLKTAAYNQAIDFLIISDAKIERLPDNVHVIHLSFGHTKKLIASKLGFSIRLEQPYKLCDFRPAYGIVFSEYLKDYDYWGHCDIDVVWGNLDTLLYKYEFYKYDKFLNRGHLTLYRNTERVNNAYKLHGSTVGDYKTVFTSPLNFGFDETQGINKIFKKNNLSEFSGRIYCDISIRYRRFTQAKEQAEDKNYDYQVYYWQKGKVYRAFYFEGTIQIEECLYLHHQKRKYRVDSIDVETVNGLWLTPSGFFPKNNESVPSLDEIKKYNEFPGRVYELCEIARTYCSPKKIGRRIWRNYLAKYYYKLVKISNNP